MAVFKALKRNKFTISYKEKEADKLLKMEQCLMDIYGYDRSQLHKVLVREKFQQVSMIWNK